MVKPTLLLLLCTMVLSTAAVAQNQCSEQDKQICQAFTKSPYQFSDGKSPLEKLCEQSCQQVTTQRQDFIKQFNKLLGQKPPADTELLSPNSQGATQFEQRPIQRPAPRAPARPTRPAPSRYPSPAPAAPSEALPYN